MEKKSNGGLVAIIVVLSLLVCALGGYFVYSEFIKKDNTNNQNTNNANTANNANSVKNNNIVISETEVKVLVDMLVANNEFGLYSNSILNSEMKNDVSIIKYALANTLDKSYSKNLNTCGTSLNDSSFVSINKSEINKYLNKTFNNILEYSLPEKGKAYDYTSTFEIIEDGESYKIACFAKSGGEKYVKNKLVKYETDENNVYIYTKFVNCISDGGITTCNNIVKYIADTSDVLVLDCSTDANGKLVSSCPSTIKQAPAEEMLPKMAEYSLNNLSDKLNTYKHTFKQIDGKFYWVSTEKI